MAQKAVSRILIIGPDLKGFKHSPDSPDNFIRLFILDQAFFHRHYDMGIFLINPGNNISSAVAVKHRMNLISVMKWLFHSNHSLNLADSL